jgi:hypothetical protein
MAIIGTIIEHLFGVALIFIVPIAVAIAKRSAGIADLVGWVEERNPTNYT